ncbi:helix-turn-helix domain-containing protein [Arthrobacter ginsengisoli]
MKQGYSNSAACRLLGIHRHTGHHWLNRRKGQRPASPRLPGRNGPQRH